MTEQKLIEIGKWLNTQGYDIDLADDFWMEDYRWDEHKTRDIVRLLDTYANETNITNTSKNNNTLGIGDVSNNEVAVCSRCGAKTVAHESKLCYGCWMLSDS